MGTEILKRHGATEAHGRYYWGPQMSQRETSRDWSEKVGVELYDLSTNFGDFS